MGVPARAMVIAALLLALPALARVAEEPEPVYRAESLWGAKHRVGIDAAWWLLRAPWREKLTGEGVTVAVIDTGIDPSHPDLAGSVVRWRDFAGDDQGILRTEPYDDHGHGTHVAGIVAGRGHFQPNPLSAYWLVGARGVAPGASLIVAKAMGHDGKGSDADVARAIRWAVDPNGDGDCSDGADVINLSIGLEGAGRISFVQAEDETTKAVRWALAKGVLVVVSSGNGGDATVAAPGGLPGVVTVGASEGARRVAAFSNGGEGLDVVAPGVLMSSYPVARDGEDFARDGYAGLAGTSMAAPVVAGVLALMVEADPSLKEKGGSEDRTEKGVRVQRVLRETATPIEGEPPERAGAGLLDAHAALARVDTGEGDFDAWGALGTFGFGLVGVGGGMRAYRRIRLRARVFL